MKKEYVVELLRRFFEIADRRGYSKPKCAEICGVRFCQIYRWKKGESAPKSSSILERVQEFVLKNSLEQNTPEPEELNSASDNIRT